MKHYLSRQKQSSSGFVLLAVIGVILILSMMIGVLMQQMTQSSQLVTTALEYHHAQMALAGHIERFKAHLEKSPDTCHAQHFELDEGAWGGVKIDLRCDLVEGRYQIVGYAKHHRRPESIVSLKREITLAY